MLVNRRVATMAACGFFGIAGASLAVAQESLIPQPPVEGEEIPLASNFPPVVPVNDAPVENGAVEPISDDNGLGLRAGSFLILPSIETGVSYTDNALSSSTNKSSDRIYSVNPSLRIESDWSRHSLRLNVDGTNDYYDKNSSEDARTVNAGVALRLDVKRDTNIDLRAGFNLDQESRGSVDLAVNANKPTDIYSYNASATINHRINRATMSLRGSYVTRQYDNTPLSDGTVDDNSDRDYREVGATIRLGYDISPQLIVFTELSYAERTRDRRVDNNGDIRDSQVYGADVGVAVTFSDLLRGEASLGYREAEYDDPTFENIDAFVLDASLTWSPTRLTEVRAAVTTGIDETSLSGSSGAVNRRASVNITHALRENIELSASGSIGFRDFNGSSLEETTYAASFGIDYDLGRNTTFGASYDFEKFNSNTPGQSYAVNTVGVRLTYSE